jgi:NNP family nitrate/nitrite transporter-like MFS transporter
MSSQLNGNPHTLIASFLHFDECFMPWVLVGALGIYIAGAAHLSPAEKGLVVAIPTLMA